MLDAVARDVAGWLTDSGAADDVAVVEGDRVVSYAELRALVDARVLELDLAQRSLVVLAAANTLSFVTTYLATLRGGHVALLAGAHHAALAAAWDVDVVVDPDGGLQRRRRPTDRELHPELALLMSTSGSTGSPKLVRLSHDNLRTNATAIGSSLGLRRDDRAITALPLHYCYGLSVLHSHLAAGAGVVLTGASVVDPCFGRAMRDGGVTNVAAVPHTFELLERVGPDTVHVESLRLMTQAGGRLAPAALARWRARTRSWGVDLYVMYGQTEATARIACLPPELAERHPNAIGRPIPGGSIELQPVEGAADGVGEIVFRGPNVMLGYATEPSDLALGRTVDALRTGDLARHDPVDDVFSIVGRRSRFIKPFGLRIDLDLVESLLGDAGIDAVATGDDERLIVVAPDSDRDALVELLTVRVGLPPTAIVIDRGEIPRAANGKVDHPAIRDRNRELADPPVAAETVADIYASVLARRDVPADSTFVSLGGDSLSYVECSVRLERRLGRLPANWHELTVAELDATERRDGLPRLDTTALLRTVGILLVVSTHMFLWYFPGGSHLMLAVVGYNTSRFHLSIDDRRQRIIAAARSMVRLAVPIVVFTALCMIVVGGYGPATLALVNNYLGPVTHQEGRWHYWFVEAVVQIVVIVSLLLAIGPVRRLERRFPYAFPLLVLAGTLVLREHWVAIGGYHNLRFQTHGVLWFFVLGWLVHRSGDLARKLATTALCAATLPGFFVNADRGWFIAAGLVLLIWCREIPLPRLAIRPIATIAAASMAIFVTHFRIFPVLDRNLPSVVAYAATIGAGIAVWSAGDLLLRQVRLALQGRARPAARAPRSPAERYVDAAPAGLTPALEAS